jgi:photosystem II stability/assembly factor-like uncharacterized protein
VDNNTGYVVTPVGMVYKTADSGITWNFMGDSFSGSYNDVSIDFF